jgi:hypothetical protein
MTNERFRISVAANAAIIVPLGPLSVIPRPGGRVSLYCNCPTDGAIQATLQLGSDTVLRRAFVNVAATAGRVQIPDDFMGDGIGVAGDAVTLELANTTGGAIIAQGLVTLA